MNPRDALNAYGQLSPPPSAKNTMASPMPTSASPATFAPSPAPNHYNRMAQFQPMVYAQSPDPITASPYPVPSSQSTMVTPPGFDSATWADFQEFRRMQQQQRFQQAPPNMAPPAAFPPQSFQHPQYPQYAQNPQNVQQPLPRDSGYGSGTFENIGQAHGLPGQQPQAPTARPGHTYGKVTAKGNSRVIRGNVKDPTRPIMNERQHIFSEGETYDSAYMHDGDVTAQEFMHFYK